MTGQRIPSLGPRGEGWVIAQSVCLVAIVVTAVAGPAWPDGVDTFLVVIGVALAGAGIGLLVAGIVALGPSLTPYPKPSEGSTLREGGAYRLVRHPIYGGFVLLGIGWSLLMSPLALVPAGLLVATFELKSRLEEALLVERYPGYGAYRARIRWRLVPWVH